jgi:spore germination cell wall hydrolase CwlJ-like protein
LHGRNPEGRNVKRLLGLLLLLLGAFGASSALAEDDGVPVGPLGIVEKLSGKKGGGVGLGMEVHKSGEAPVVSEVTAEALALIRAKELRQGDGVAPLTSEQQLLAIDSLLKKLNAEDPEHTAGDIYTIERMSNESLKKLIQAGRDPNAPEWLQRLARLARMEAAARGLDVQEILNEPLGEPARQRPSGSSPSANSGGPGGPNSPHAAPMGNDLGGTSPPFEGAQESDVEILARIVKGEIPESAPIEGHVAVAAVVLNRVRAGNFGKTIAEVAHAPWQFSCYNADQRDRLYWGPIPDYAWKAARAALAGENPVPGCTHYFNPYLVSPSWAATMHLYRRIGTSVSTTHDFYRP